MRLHWVLLPLLSALAVNAHSDLAKRQNDGDSSSSSSEVSETTTTGGGDESTTTTGGGDEDTTVTVTTTVSNEASTESSRVTRTVTSTSTFIEVSTDRETTTVTSRDQATATETEYTTTTITRSNEKRDLYLIPRTLEADPTEAVPITPAPTATAVEELKREAQPGPNVFKRATVTETETVTEGNGGETTVVETITRTVVTVTTRQSTTTEVITETEQADASTTITTTRTFTVIVVTGGTSVFTEPETSTTGGSPAETSGSNNNNDNGGGGLSTGAKAGIGAGAGVAGLAIIAGLAWFCFRKRRGGSKPDHDDMFGSSEVPVGAAAAGASRPMTHQPSTSASYTRSPTLPNVAPEGYRGTAMGDGRAGYAKPEPYGSAYTRQSAQAPPSSVSPVSPHTGYSRPTDRNSTLMGSSQGGDYLPEHHTPGDMNNAAYMGRAASTSPGPQTAELGHDGHGARWQSPGATEMDNTPAGYHQNGQVPSNVYEMPGPDHR